MADLAHANRVKETSTTVGLGAYDLAGAVVGFQGFVAALGNGGRCNYTATNGVDWETVIGVVTDGAPDTLSRDEILSSSNAGAAINWGVGTKTLFIAPDAERYPEFLASIVPPTYPSPGMRWLDLVNNIEFTRFSDGFAEVWAELGPEDIPDMADLFKILSADDAGGQNVTTAQPWFPTAGGVLVAAATTYRAIGLLHLTRAAGAAAHTTGLLFGGTATLTSIKGRMRCNVGDVATVVAEAVTLIDVATVLPFKASSTSATEVIHAFFEGIIRVNAGGTFIPQFQYITNAPGGTPTVKANSFFAMIPLGINTVTTQGLWA